MENSILIDNKESIAKISVIFHSFTVRFERTNKNVELHLEAVTIKIMQNRKYFVKNSKCSGFSHGIQLKSQ